MRFAEGDKVGLPPLRDSEGVPGHRTPPEQRVQRTAVAVNRPSNALRATQNVVVFVTQNVVPLSRYRWLRRETAFWVMSDARCVTREAISGFIATA
jgi:hypothetical protein